MSTDVAQSLPPPAFYFPPRHGRYDVAPGLNRFGKDLGAGPADGHAFQFDETFASFRAAKLASRDESLGRYYVAADVSGEVYTAVCSLIIRRLQSEHPTLFQQDLHSDGGSTLYCRLTAETLTFDGELRLVDARSPRPVSPPFVDAFDALACQVQEDLAVVRATADRHWLAAAHVTLPNGWAPAEKVGHTFAGVHEPVAGMDEMNRRGEHFVKVMTEATDGLVRFAWGVTFDDRLNLHPDVSRRPFDPLRPRAFLRVERQTIWGLPHVGASLFTIRPYLYHLDSLRRDPDLRDALASALRTMPEASQRYKGLFGQVEPLVRWLQADAR